MLQESKHGGALETAPNSLDLRTVDLENHDGCIVVPVASTLRKFRLWLVCILGQYGMKTSLEMTQDCKAESSRTESPLVPNAEILVAADSDRIST